MMSAIEALEVAKKLHKVVIKVIYFNKSIEYYIDDKIPEKNEYIPDGYCGDVVVIANYLVH